MNSNQDPSDDSSSDRLESSQDTLSIAILEERETVFRNHGLKASSYTNMLSYMSKSDDVKGDTHNSILKKAYDCWDSVLDPKLKKAKMLQGTYHCILLWAREEANKTPGRSVEQVLAETNFSANPLEKWQIPMMVMPMNEPIATPVTRLKPKRTFFLHDLIDKTDDQAAYALLDAFEEVVGDDAQLLDSSAVFGSPTYVSMFITAMFTQVNVLTEMWGCNKITESAGNPSSSGPSPNDALDNTNSVTPEDLQLGLFASRLRKVYSAETSKWITNHKGALIMNANKVSNMQSIVFKNSETFICGGCTIKCTCLHVNTDINCIMAELVDIAGTLKKLVYEVNRLRPSLLLKSKSAFLKCTGAFEAIAEMAFNLYKFRNLPDITKSAEMAQLLKIVVKLFKKSAVLTQFVKAGHASYIKLDNKFSGLLQLYCMAVTGLCKVLHIKLLLLPKITLFSRHFLRLSFGNKNDIGLPINLTLAICQQKGSLNGKKPVVFIQMKHNDINLRLCPVCHCIKLLDFIQFPHCLFQNMNVKREMTSI
ncbi:hypothetical protein HDU80_007495 [Chytriomyces hyalinus]|nr:hypothetical protein HDU80_007495 [Chytriomyces hyalinus]